MFTQSNMDGNPEAVIYTKLEAIYNARVSCG